MAALELAARLRKQAEEFGGEARRLREEAAELEGDTDNSERDERYALRRAEALEAEVDAEAPPAWLEARAIRSDPAQIALPL